MISANDTSIEVRTSITVGTRRFRAAASSGPSASAAELSREEVVSTVGPDKAAAYFIGASTEDGENIKFEVARMGPRFLARLIGDQERAELKLSYEHTTAGGWRIGIAVSAAAPYQRPKGARVQGSFSVLIAR